MNGTDTVLAHEVKDLRERNGVLLRALVVLLSECFPLRVVRLSQASIQASIDGRASLWWKQTADGDLVLWTEKPAVPSAPLPVPGGGAVN